MLEGQPLAELERFMTRRERRLRRLGMALLISVLILSGLFLWSYKTTIWDNEMANPDWVEFKNPEGDKLSGLLLKPTDIPVEGAPAVIVVHDLTGHKEQLNRLSFELVRHGYIVLAVDLRDHGRSGGVTTYGDVANGGEAYDVVAAYERLLREADVNAARVGLVGDGFGGAQALLAANLLIEQGKNVTAVVVWGVPLNITTIVTDGKYEEYWRNVQLYLDRRAGEVDWSYDEDLRNRTVDLHLGAANWSAESVYLIYGEMDDLVPSAQFTDRDDIGEPNAMSGLDHELSENPDVIKATIVFLRSRLAPSSPMVEISSNYDLVSDLNWALNIMNVVVMVLTFLTVYEGAVMKKTSRSYIPELSKANGLMKLGVYTLFDIVVYTGIGLSSGWFYSSKGANLFMLQEGQEMVPFMAAGSFFTMMVLAGALLTIVGFTFWYLEARIFKKDEERTEESCGNLRGIGLALIAFAIIIINFLFGQLLLTGANYPKELVYLLPTLIMFAFFLGHELWMRKLIHPKINAMLGALFIRRRWPFQLVFFGIMYALYCALMLIMLGSVGKAVWGPDFMKVYGTLVLAIGLVATIIYHRSRSILASVTYSTIMAPWLLNLLYHF